MIIIVRSPDKVLGLLRLSLLNKQDACKLAYHNYLLLDQLHLMCEVVYSLLASSQILLRDQRQPYGRRMYYMRLMIGSIVMQIL
jgi:hypothetical protein